MAHVLTRLTGYEDDFFLWSREQADALRSLGRERSNSPVDWENVAEEIESLGKRDRRRCESLVGLLLLHLLKLQYWPIAEPRNHWQTEIRAFRKALARILRDSPSLQSNLDSFSRSEQTDAVEEMSDFLKQFPILSAQLKRRCNSTDLLFTANELLDAAFLPDVLNLTSEN